MNYQDQLDIRNGVIYTPGKFQGEPRYVPYFWDIYLNGGADWDDGRVIGIRVTTEDRELFPELKKRRVIRLMETNQGFVIEV